MKKEWTKEELVKAFADFHDAMVYVNANYSTWKSTVVDCDKAFCDLRHYCEFDYPTDRAKRTRVCKELRDYSQKRRKCKDLVAMFIDFSSGMDDRVKNNLYEKLRHVERENQKQEKERYYYARVIKDLK